LRTQSRSLRVSGFVVMVALAAGCGDGNEGAPPVGVSGGAGGKAGAGGAGGKAAGGTGAGGTGGAASNTIGTVGEINGGSADAGAASTVMVDAALSTREEKPLQTVDAAALDLGAPLTSTAAEAEWTVFVYGHADHNLSPSMVKDIKEMSDAKLNDKVQVVTMVDFDGSAELADGEKFPTGTLWYRILGDGKEPKELMTGPELDTDDPMVLAKSIVQAFRAFPAKRYGLVLWDHGGAWTGGFGGDTQDGTRDGEAMPVVHVASAVREAARALGLKGEKPFEFLTFDTCLMSGAEIAPAFQDLAKVFTANAEIDFGDGLDYAKTLSWLASNPTADVLEFGKNEAAIWDAHHLAAGGLDTLFRSHAVFDTAKFPRFVSAMKTLGTAVSDASQARSVARALYLSAPEYFAGQTDEVSNVALRDVGNIMQSLKGSDNKSVSDAAGRVMDELSNARIGLAAGDLRKGQAGLHIYGGPVTQLDDDLLKVYGGFNPVWESATGWGSNVLSKLKGAAPTQIAKVTATLTNTSTVNEKAATMTINSPSPDTTYVEGWLMQDSTTNKGKEALILGTVGHGFVGPGDSQIRWNGRATVLVASPTNIPVTVSPWTFAQEGQTIRTPFLSVEGVLTDDEQDPSQAWLLLDAETGVSSHIVITTEAGHYVVLTLAELASLAEATFSPLRVNFNLEKEEIESTPSSVGVVVPASGQLHFRRETVAPGTYYLLGYAEDFWGNGDFEATVVELSK
jgi:hypothetical protein